MLVCLHSIIIRLYNNSSFSNYPLLGNMLLSIITSVTSISAGDLRSSSAKAPMVDTKRIPPWTLELHKGYHRVAVGVVVLRTSLSGTAQCPGCQAELVPSSVSMWENCTRMHVSSKESERTCLKCLPQTSVIRAMTYGSSANMLEPHGTIYRGRTRPAHSTTYKYNQCSQPLLHPGSKVVPACSYPIGTGLLPIPTLGGSAKLF